jgi:elongation factor P
MPCSPVPAEASRWSTGGRGSGREGGLDVPEMTSTTDWRSGMTVEVDGVPMLVLESQHIKPGKGQAFVRARLKNLQTGAIFERTFRAGEKVPAALVERKDVQFLYEADGQYHLMDTETYEQFAVSAETVGEQRRFLKEGMQLVVTMYKGDVVDVELPTTIEATVTETAPGVRGDTVANVMKPAVIDTGATVQVPLFIERGDRIRVDTRTGDYVGRV